MHATSTHYASSARVEFEDGYHILVVELPGGGNLAVEFEADGLRELAAALADPDGGYAHAAADTYFTAQPVDDGTAVIQAAAGGIAVLVSISAQAHADLVASVAAAITAPEVTASC